MESRGGGGDGVGGMRGAIASALAGAATRDQLQEAARELVRELRRHALTPEKALIQIKTMLAEAGLDPTFSATDDTIGLEGSLYRDILAWSIRAYSDDRP
jgi:hypothetical protein